MPSLFDTIPGYREAVRAEAASRLESFLDASDLLCGVEVLPMNARHLAILELGRNSFVTGGAQHLGDLLPFMWVLSPSFPQKGKRNKILRQLRKLQVSRLIEAISKYIEEVFADAPATGRSGETIPWVAWPAHLVDVFGCEYHWPDHLTLGMPLKRAFQYLRCIQRRNSPQSLMFNPSDKVRGQWLRQVNAKN
jgi:hypothetical protein